MCPAISRRAASSVAANHAARSASSFSSSAQPGSTPLGSGRAQVSRRGRVQHVVGRERGDEHAYNQAHRWYYFSEMQTDEVLFIRVHDSANDGRARLSFHTSFDNPLALGAPPRESIEVRTLVFFSPAA
ncbi:MAG: CmcJ/NvfI family oxidoreductase [Stellaceae bacterium]